MLTSRVSDYPTISNGKTRIPGVNDGEEFELTDVSRPYASVQRTLYIARGAMATWPVLSHCKVDAVGIV